MRKNIVGYATVFDFITPGPSDVPITLPSYLSCIRIVGTVSMHRSKYETTDHEDHACHRLVIFSGTTT